MTTSSPQPVPQPGAPYQPTPQGFQPAPGYQPPAPAQGYAAPGYYQAAPAKPAHSGSGLPAMSPFLLALWGVGIVFFLVALIGLAATNVMSAGKFYTLCAYLFAPLGSFSLVGALIVSALGGLKPGQPNQPRH
ncbi:MAG: hypothetical protein LBM66_02240 [Bifidobacteriaceae bacterium]|jgi:hypothetical protein|nr:hypothetical protein [Bifidobacteriaceae bacterium]